MTRRIRRWTGALAVVAMVGAIAAFAGCSHGGPDHDQARLVVDGSATVTPPEGDSKVVTGSATLDFGSVVDIDEGTATLELAAGQVYELRAGFTRSDGSTTENSSVLVDAPPTLVAGDALVTGGFPAAIRYGTTTESALGAVKISADVPLAAAYAGRTSISGAGGLSEVRGLRQVVLTASATPEPFGYDGADPWDRRYLGEAIAFGNRLEALARGYTNDLRPGNRTASFYEAVLPALAAESEFSGDLLDDRPAGETLVGAAIALEGRNGTFRDRWNSVFAFRDQGAAWGLVAADQGVSSAPVLDTIEVAIGQSPLGGRPPSPTTSRPTATTSTTTTTASPTSGPTTTTTPPTTPPPPPPDNGILTPVVTPAEQILDDVLGAIGVN